MPVPVGIAAVMPTTLRIFLAELHRGLAHHVLIHRRRAGFGGRSFAGLRVVRSEAVKFFRLLQRGFKAFAFLRQNVDDNRMVAAAWQIPAC